MLSWYCFFFKSMEYDIFKWCEEKFSIKGVYLLNFKVKREYKDWLGVSHFYSRIVLNLIALIKIGQMFGK